MLLRPDALAHFASPDADLALRLPFPRGARRAAGEDLEAPCLPARPRLGGDETERQLDHLFVAVQAFRGAGVKPAMPAGLHGDGSDFSERPAAVDPTAGEMLRTGWRFREGN